MAFLDVVFLPPELVFPPHFLEIVVDVKSSFPPRIKCATGVIKGMLPVRYVWSTKPLFVSVQFKGECKTAYKDEVKSGCPEFWGYHRF